MEAGNSFFNRSTIKSLSMWYGLNPEVKNEGFEALPTSFHSVFVAPLSAKSIKSVIL
jgi:hypothetical protein